MDTADVDCQTDPSLDQTSPLYKYARTGEDFGSQIDEAQVSVPSKTSGYIYIKKIDFTVLLSLQR